MIAYLRGRVLTTTAETMIVDVGGVGYELYCSGGALSKAGAGGTGGPRRRAKKEGEGPGAPPRSLFVYPSVNNTARAFPTSSPEYSASSSVFAWPPISISRLPVVRSWL